MYDASMLLSQVQAFLMVLDTGSFTEAAFRLNVAQSSVSHSLSRLEKSLGVRLLDRDRTGVRLTQQGERLLPYFRSIASGVSQLQQEAQKQQQEISGKVKIGSFPSTSSRILPRTISELKQLHPAVKVSIFEGTTQDIHLWLDNHTVDLGFVELPTLPHYTLIEILQDELRLIAPLDHPLAAQPAVSLAEIARHPYVLSRFGCEPLIRQAFDTLGLTLDVVYEVRDLATLLALVEEGIGLTLVPELLFPASTLTLASVKVTPSIPRHIALASLPGDCNNPGPQSPGRPDPVVGKTTSEALLKLESGAAKKMKPSKKLDLAASRQVDTLGNAHPSRPFIRPFIRPPSQKAVSCLQMDGVAQVSRERAPDFPTI